MSCVPLLGTGDTSCVMFLMIHKSSDFWVLAIAGFMSCKRVPRHSYRDMSTSSPADFQAVLFTVEPDSGQAWPLSPMC